MINQIKNHYIQSRVSQIDQDFLGFEEDMISPEDLQRILTLLSLRNNSKDSKFSTINNPIFPFKYPIEHFYTIADWFDHYGDKFYSKKIGKRSIESYLVKLSKDSRNNANLYLPYEKVKPKDYFNNYSLFRDMQESYLSKSTGLFVPMRQLLT